MQFLLKKHSFGKIKPMKKLLLVSLIIGFFSMLQAQRIQTPTLSPFSEIKQEIGLTEIKIQYSRPSAKGRTVFGELVPYGKTWRTGANASTKIFLSEAANIGGHPIDSGTYAIYTIPQEKSWTIIIHSQTRYRSIAGNRLKPEDDVCRFEVPVVHNPIMEETFTMQFTDIATTGCNIRISWENTQVNIPIKVEVDAKIEAQIAQIMSNAEVPHRTYFEAAQYYHHNGKDVVKAIEWIKKGLELSPDNFRYGLLHAKILFKDGQRDEAMNAINLANAWAEKAKNSNYIEQTALFREEMMK